MKVEGITVFNDNVLHLDIIVAQKPNSLMLFTGAD